MERDGNQSPRLATVILLILSVLAKRHGVVYRLLIVLLEFAYIQVQIFIQAGKCFT